MSALPTISIITSVYDAKDYLPATVASILAQTYRDFELLLVEDGSPNGCGALCDELAKQDERIRVFHKPNGGPASAMNVGLKNARGRYIGFVDSDDLIEPTMYETLYNTLREQGVKIVGCNADAFDENGNPVPGAGVSIAPPGARPALDLLMDTFTTGGFYGLLCWNKLMDISLFRDRGITFDESMFFGDDASELHRVYEGETVYCLPDVLYHYRRRSGSMTATVFPPRKLDDLKMYRRWVEYFAARPNSEDYYRHSAAWYWQVTHLFWCQAGKAGNQKQLKEDFTPYFKFLNSIFPDLMRNPLLSAGQKLRLVLFSMSPTVYYNAAAVWGRLNEKRKGS